MKEMNRTMGCMLFVSFPSPLSSDDSASKYSVWVLFVFPPPPPRRAATIDYAVGIRYRPPSTITHLSPITHDKSQAPKYPRYHRSWRTTKSYAIPLTFSSLNHTANFFNHNIYNKISSIFEPNTK